MLAWMAAILVAFAAVTAAPVASAGPALLFDTADGKVLYAEDQDHQWHPASLTKIMTAFVVFAALKEGKLRLDTKITCSAHASSQPPTRVGLAVGAQISVETALQALIIQSANDVAVMLAEAVAGTHEAFVERMNATAARLGMTRTKFINANGLPDAEQVMTARDLAKLATAVVREYPDRARLWSLLDMHIGKRHFGTFNGLLVNYAGADGMKTLSLRPPVLDGWLMVELSLGFRSHPLRRQKRDGRLDGEAQLKPQPAKIGQGPCLQPALPPRPRPSLCDGGAAQVGPNKGSEATRRHRLNAGGGVAEPCEQAH
jgi:hypothetical protein